MRNHNPAGVCGRVSSSKLLPYPHKGGGRAYRRTIRFLDTSPPSSKTSKKALRYIEGNSQIALDFAKLFSFELFSFDLAVSQKGGLELASVPLFSSILRGQLALLMSTKRTIVSSLQLADAP